MYLSRIEPAAAGLDRPAFWKRIEEGYGVHEMVWSWFADTPDRRRDFLFRQEGIGLAAKFYTLSDRPPVDPDGAWNISVKPFAPVLREGERLVFSLRANPARCASGGPGKGSRHDVVMDGRRRPRRGGDCTADPREWIQAACFEWLEARAVTRGFAVAPGEVRVDGYRQHRVHKSGKPAIRFSTVEFEGILTVQDPDRFVSALRKGFGPAKGFGCGLMLIRRAGSSRR